MFDASPLVRVTDMNSTLSITDDGRVTKFTFSIVDNALSSVVSVGTRWILRNIQYRVPQYL
jgi:hypothetical protein